MNTTLAIEQRPRSLVRLFSLEAWYEFLRLLRSPGFSLPTLAFPAMFYILFAVVLQIGRGASMHMPTYLVVSYGIFGIIGPALFGFGVGVATERGEGWMLLKRATPMPPMAYFNAKLVMAMVFALIITAVMFTLGATLGGVSLPAADWVKLAVVNVLGTLPFCAMGLAIGYWARPQAAVAIVQMIYLPMAALSGLWFPIQILPEAVQSIAVFLPPYHLSQLGFHVIGMDVGTSPVVHMLALLGYAIVFLALAVAGYRRDEGQHGR